jgi:hypothetical protein
VTAPINPSVSDRRRRKTVQKNAHCSPKEKSQPSSEVASEIAAQTASRIARISE